MTKIGLESQFTVTRQSRWPDGKLIVEITQGGIDYTNADALCNEFQGEFETFTGLGEAVKAAIAIAEQWKKKAGKTGKEIRMAVGSTMGMSAHFDDMPANIKTYRSLKKQAAEYDEKLDKCAHCGEVLGDERYRNADTDWSGDEFCREYCAEQNYYHNHKDDKQEDTD